MQNKTTTLRQTLPAICSALAGQKGVKIVWRGPPRTDGATIYSNPIPVEADEATVKVVIGDLDHECGHIRYSDVEAYRTRQAPALQKEVWNALEDTFIERRLGDDFLGCQQTLAESVEIAIAKGHCRTGTKGPGDALVTFCDAWGRKNVLQQGVEPILTTSRAELVKHLDEKGVQRLEALLATRLYSANSTEETFLLSGAIITLLKDIQKEQENPPPQPKPQPAKQGDEDSSQGEGQGDEDSSQGEGQGDEDSSQGEGQGDEDSNQGEGQGDEDSSQGEGQGDEDSSQCEGQGDEDSSQGEGQGDEAATGNGAGRGGSARQILEDDQIPQGAVVDRRAIAGVMTAEAAKGNFVFNPAGIQPPPSGENLPRYNELKSAVAGEISQLQRRLAVEFQTARRVRQVISEEGRLDGRRLPQALLGDPRICRKRVTSPVAKPAISLVLDCSGSMGLEYAGGRLVRKNDIVLATQAVAAVAEVCAVMGAPFEVITFAGSQIGAVKTFDTPLARARGRLGAIDAGGGTPTAEALWLAGTRLISRREERKILMLVTDGSPDDMPAAQQVAGLIERSGIELYGIGIGAPAVRISQICQKSGLIKKPDELASAVLSALSERVLAAA